MKGQIKLNQLAYGIATFIPGLYRLRIRGGATGGTDNARYCYSVWLRHLVVASESGFNTGPGIVAELGPGDSIGIGLAALLSGSEKYYALDVVGHASLERNLKTFTDLVSLFKNRVNIPGQDEFPQVKPYLDTYEFPGQILNGKKLQNALNTDRVQRIQDSITNPDRVDSMVQYRVPWHSRDGIQRHSVDMIYSQAVLEHVDDLQEAYRAMGLWLKPNGFISHQIDYRSHGTAAEWNGHWTHSDLMWRLIRGGRPYLLNREPHSAHIRTLQDEGFRVVCERKVCSNSNISRNNLAQRFRDISDDDLCISGAFIQSVRQN